MSEPTVEPQGNTPSGLLSAERPHVVVIGLMGVGKSTIGKALAAELGVTVRDSDDEITDLFGVTGAEVAADHGVATLHRIEAGLLLGALAADSPSVITAAASVVEDEPVRRAVARRASVVHLTADVDDILRRQSAGGHRRPMDRDELAELADRRRPLFTRMADIELVSDQDPGALVDVVVAGLAEARRSP